MKYTPDFPTKIGSDPEFIFTDPSNRIISLMNILNLSRHRMNEHTREFGTDGHGLIAELRPPATDTALEHVRHIRRIMCEALATYPKLQGYNWLSGNWIGGKPIGGHIHFSRSYNQGGPLIKKMLSYIVMPILLSLEDTGRAARSGMMFQSRYYGLPDDSRIKHHGGWEWRAPSSWLISPGITLGVLNLTEIVFKYAKWFDNMLIEKDKEILSYSNEKIQRFDLAYFKERVNLIWKYIKMFAKRADYRWPSIAYLKQVASRKHTWCTGQDMKIRWRLPDLAISGLPVHHRHTDFNSLLRNLYSGMYKSTAYKEYKDYIENNQGVLTENEMNKLFRVLKGNNIELINKYSITKFTGKRDCSFKLPQAVNINTAKYVYESMNSQITCNNAQLLDSPFIKIKPNSNNKLDMILLYLLLSEYYIV